MANRVLIGKRGTSDYGLYVSNPGVNVVTATDDDLMFNSDAVEGFNALQTGTVSIPAPGNSIGFNEGTSSWISYSSLGLTYPPLILLSKGGAAQTAPLRGFEADWQVDGEGFNAPTDVDIFLFTEIFYENDFTNKRFRVTRRNFLQSDEATFQNLVGTSSASTISYFLFAIGDITANGGANYFTA